MGLMVIWFPSWDKKRGLETCLSTKNLFIMTWSHSSKASLPLTTNNILSLAQLLPLNYRSHHYWTSHRNCGLKKIDQTTLSKVPMNGQVILRITRNKLNFPKFTVLTLADLYNDIDNKNQSAFKFNIQPRKRNKDSHYLRTQSCE